MGGNVSENILSHMTQALNSELPIEVSERQAAFSSKTKEPHQGAPNF